MGEWADVGVGVRCAARQDVVLWRADEKRPAAHCGQEMEEASAGIQAAELP